MTLVLSAAGALANLQLGFNEAASAIYIARTIGSVVSRKTDSLLFNVLERDFDVKIKAIPPWLENFEFSRTCGIKGHQFRSIEGAVCMEDVRIDQLQGFASLLVLCCRYVLDVKAMSKLVETLLVGGIGNIGNQELKQQGLPFTTKTLIAQFIRATVDSDKKSRQAQKAAEWMAKLLSAIQSPWRTITSKTRAQQYQRLRHLMTALLGGETANERFREPTAQYSQSTHEGSSVAVVSGVRRVYDTMSSDCAYAALAAAANGADVAVLCMCEDTEVLIPGPEARNAKFLVRLWIRQPPEEVSNMFRHSDNDEVATALDAVDAELAATPITIFGGQLELSRACSRQYRFNCSDGDLLKLWKSGFDYGRHMSILVKPETKTPNVQMTLKFTINTPKERISPQADQLSKLLQDTTPGLGDLTRSIARIVDEYYKLDGYGEFDKGYLPCLKVVLISVTVGFLHNITGVDTHTDDLQSYAASASAVEPGGDIEAFMPALIQQGADIYKLMWTAARLWGGAVQASQGHPVRTTDIIGIVAPHCNILLDLIRDPIHFVQTGTRSKLLYMCRGSLPLIARNPSSGFITADMGRHEFRQAVPEPNTNEHNVVGGSNAPTNDMTFSFEPDVNADNPYHNVFCCWYVGQLAFQVSPRLVMNNLLMRGTERPEPNVLGSSALQLRRQMAEAAGIRNLSWREVLSLEHFTVNKDSPQKIVVVRAFERPGWLVALLGLSDPERCIFQRLDQVSWDTTFIQEGDIIVLSG